MSDQRKPYRVKLPNGMETEVLMSPDYRDMHYPESVVVEDRAQVPDNKARDVSVKDPETSTDPDSSGVEKTSTDT